MSTEKGLAENRSDWAASYEKAELARLKALQRQRPLAYWGKRASLVIAMAVTSYAQRKHHQYILKSPGLRENILRLTPASPRFLGAVLKRVGYRRFQALTHAAFMFSVFASKRFGVNKRHLPAWAYMPIFLTPAMSFWSISRGDFYYITWMLLLIFPIVEKLFGSDTVNPTRQEASILNRDASYAAVPMLWAPCQFLLQFYGCWAASGRSGFKWTFGHFVGLCVSVGIVGGALGINVAHELIHKSSKIEQTVGKSLLVSVCYGHFAIEHIEGHHKRVATPNDPASSRVGETLYSFWLRSVSGSWKSAFDIERRRLLLHVGGQNGAEKGRVLIQGGTVTTPSIGKMEWLLTNLRHNRPLHLTSFSAGLVALVYKFFGKGGLLFFMGQSFVAFTMLEVINYIEHYGLTRRKRGEEGTAFEPVTVQHSWNADASLTNVLFLKLQRHSDHHAFATRRYQILRSFAESPQLPFGYSGMVLLAFFPPLFFRVMHPRLEEWRKKSDALHCNSRK